MASDEITRVKQDEPAPFTGDLYPIDDSIRFAIAIEDCQNRAAVDLGYNKRLFQIELKKEKDLAASKIRADQQRIELMRMQLEESQAWYRSPVFVATVTAAATVAALLAATVLIQSTAEVRP